MMWTDGVIKHTEMFPDVQLHAVFFLLYEYEAELINCVFFLNMRTCVRDIKAHKAYLIVSNKTI